MLSIVVCIKQVPDALKAVFDQRTGAVDRSTAENIMNPDDLHALELALSLRDAYGAKVTVLSMGPPQAADVITEAFALGVDTGILVSDRRFAGSDSLITSKILSRAISRIRPFDLILTGCEAIDGNTAHVGYQLSEFLEVPLVTKIHKFQIENGHAVIERLSGHEYQKLKVRLPLLCAIGKNVNRVRFPRLADIRESGDKTVTVMTMDDIGGTEQEYGTAGSPTVTIQTEFFSHKRVKEVLAGSIDEKVGQLIHKLKKNNILRY